jgi:hypothetical protein
VGLVFFPDSREHLESLVVGHLKARNSLVKNPEEDFDIESDCEGGSTDAEEEASKCESGEQTHVTLVVGSFSACGHFFTLFLLGEMTNFSDGSQCSSISAQTRSRLLPSGHKVLALA